MQEASNCFCTKRFKTNRSKKKGGTMEVDGYYFDGEKLWIIYKDENGKVIIKEEKDER